MTTTIAPVGEVSEASATLASGLSEYREAVEFARLSDADLVAELRGLESLRRRLHALDHTLIAELDHRGVGVSCGARSTAGLLQTTLRLSRATRAPAPPPPDTSAPAAVSPAIHSSPCCPLPRPPRLMA